MIISLTSIFGRQHALLKKLYSLLNQTVKLPIHVWLSEEPYLLDEGFPNKVIPTWFTDFYDESLTVHWVPNEGPYRKLLPALKMFPTESILVVDDDTEFDPTFVEFCLHMYKVGVMAFRANKITDKPYNDWAAIEGKPVEGLQLFSKGNGGVIYDAKLFQDSSFHDSSQYLSICPTNDDIWFNMWRIKQKIPLQVVPIVNYYTSNHQEKRLWFLNENSNDKMILALSSTQ